MKISDLRRTNTAFDLDTLTTYSDLFAGGEQFRKNVTRYLERHDHEEVPQYQARCRTAHYLNYTSSIVNYFASWLWTRPPTVAIDGAHPTPFYEGFQADCDDRGTDLKAFVRDRFVEALQFRRAYWRVEFPAPGEEAAEPTAEAADDSRKGYESSGAGEAVLVPIPAKNITHWKRDEKGAFVWCVEYAKTTELADFEDKAPTVTEMWTLWRANGDHKRWQVQYAEGEAPKDSEQAVDMPPPFDPTGTIPIVELELPIELWVLNLLADAQLELFRKRNALSWSMDRTCYAMAVLKSDSKKPIGRMGAGRWLRLATTESLEWPAPPSTPFDVIGAYISTLKDELHRVASQMAQGVDNNAAAVGRSAESKATDNSATEIVLEAFGGYIREAIEKTFDLIALGRAEPDAFECDVQGCDHYHVADLDTLTENAVAGELLKIPSATLRKEVMKRVAKGFLPGADETTIKAIFDEIDAGIGDGDAAAPTAVNTAKCPECGASTAADATECQLCKAPMVPSEAGAASAGTKTAPKLTLVQGGKSDAKPEAAAPATDGSLPDNSTPLANAAAVAKRELPQIFGYEQDNGIFTVNEIRYAKGFEKVDGGDVSVILWKAQQAADALKLAPAAAELTVK